MIPVICVDCACTMTVKQNDFTVRDHASTPFPATYWRGDLWVCPQCGKRIATGFGGDIDEYRAERMGIASTAFEYTYHRGEEVTP